MCFLQKEVMRLGISRQVVIISEYLSQLDLYSLANACDVYLSLHRGEGFGLGIAEAMQLSKPVVVTEYSAPLEFCNEDTALLVPCRIAVMKGDALATQMGQCAEPDIDAAAMALRRLHGNRSYAENIGNRARLFLEKHFSDAAFKTSIQNLQGLS